MPASSLPESALIVGYDFSTGSVKALAFDLTGQVVAEARLPTDLWTEGGVSELSLLQLEGQARSITRLVASELRAAGRLSDWVAAGISATHHTAGLIDANGNQVRRAICWNDQTLRPYHVKGQARLGGPAAVETLIGGPWAERYTLSHLVKDEETLPAAAWARGRWVAQHGSLAAGYLTGRFDCVSVSAAASTGMLDFRTNHWAPGMLDALVDPELRRRVQTMLPHVLAQQEPVGPLSESVALDAGLPDGVRPVIYPTLDDQAAGLVGGGAVDAGQVAVILGNSAVVNASSATPPRGGTLDCMRLNWGPYLWMRCYTNGAQFLDKLVGPTPDWPALEAAARAVPAGCNGVTVSPFVFSEPSLGVLIPRFGWSPAVPSEPGVQVRAAFEALAYLVALAVQEHEAAGQTITRLTVSGGIARSELMMEILASVLGRPLERLESQEGPALGAAVAALAGVTHQPVAAAVARLVRFRSAAAPNPAWQAAYRAGLNAFAASIGRS